MSSNAPNETSVEMQYKSYSPSHSMQNKTSDDPRLENAAKAIHERIWQGGVLINYDSKDIKEACMKMALAVLVADDAWRNS